MKSETIYIKPFLAVKWKLKWIAYELRLRTTLAKLRIDMLSNHPITGDAPAIVCLTSYGNRMKNVHYTVQTIANGKLRPKRIVLWISHADAHLITPELRTLERRGLEIALTENYGSHKKYFPYAVASESANPNALPLVTADDDLLYPAGWLSDLIEEASRDPRPIILAHRAHRIRFENGVIGNYLSWGWEQGSTAPSYANVATSGAGVLFPSNFISQVGHLWQTEFLQTAPTADDLWLHSRSVLLGVPTKQIAQSSSKVVEHHPKLPGALSEINVVAGMNDVVISNLYTPEVCSIIRASCETD